MQGLAIITLPGFLATLLLVSAGEIKVPKKMIVAAAKHEYPHSHLTKLYAESVLPDRDIYDAWFFAGKFAKESLKGTNTGFQHDTVDFPSLTDESAVKSFPPSVEKTTGRPFRNYRVSGDFHANNIYGARTRLHVTAFLRTHDNESWEAYKIFITDPSKPILSGIILSRGKGAWHGFKPLQAPDSLYAQLDAYIKKPSKESGVQKKKVYGWEIEGPYVNGKKHGHFVERNSNGIVFEGEYVDDKRHGRWVRRNKDRKVIEDGEYVEGEKHGKWNEPSNAVGNYVHGKRQGRWIRRNSDGTVEEVDYVDDKRHGRWIWRAPDGETGGGEYVNGKRQGRWVERTIGGAARIGPYVDGKKHGRWTFHKLDGTVNEGPYVDGKKHGWWTLRKPDGIVVKVEFVRGRITVR